MPRILLVDDNDTLALGLQRTLEAEGHDVSVMARGTGAPDRIRRTEPDLVILELMLPDIDGFTVLQELRTAGETVPVVILTTRADEADKVYGFRVGADDYVTKPFGLSELVARVHAVIRRSARMPMSDPRSMLHFGGIAIDIDARSVTRNGCVVHLTPKEFDLLLALARQPGVALSRRWLLEHVWEHQADVHTRTVDIHMAGLRRKIERDPARPQHLITVRKRGYRLDA